MTPRVLLCTGLFTTITAAMVAAQTSPAGSIAGRVLDAQGRPIPNVTVSATDDAGRVRRQTISAGDGAYRLFDLEPGLYAVAGEADGLMPRTRRDLDVRAGLHARVDLVMDVGGVRQTVTVAAGAPLLDTRSAVHGVNLSAALMTSLPLGSSRHWSDILSVTPGVTIRSPGALSTVHAVRGSDAGSHVIQVDGASLGSAAIGSTASVNIVPAAMADVQVKTAAIDASAPIGVGAVVVIATKSGANAFQGSLGLDVQPRRWNARNVPGGESSAVSAFLPEGAISGPLVRDGLWFFAAGRDERARQTVGRTADQLRALASIAGDVAPLEREVGGPTALIKATGRLARGDEIELLYQYMPREIENAAPTDAAVFARTVLGGERNVALRATSAWGPRLLTRFHASFTDNAQQNIVGSDAPARRIFTSTVAAGSRLTGSGLVATLDNGGTGQSGRQRFWRATAGGDVTLATVPWAGRHDLRAGLAFQRNHEESIAHFANGGFAREESILRDPANPAAGIVPFWLEVWDVDRVQASLGTSDDLSLYVQDDWEVHPRLVIGGGLRADAIERTDDLFGLTVQRGVAVGPRVRTVLALGDEGWHSLRGTWGRVHDVLSGNRAVGGAASAGKTDLYDLDFDGTFETRLVTPASTAVSRNRIYDTERGQPYIDEWTAGYRGWLPARVTLDVAVVHREYRHRTAAVEENGIYTGGVFRGYRDESQNDIYRVTANTWNWLVYDGLEIQAARTAGAFSGLASYTRAWRRMAGGWQPNDPASIIQPSAFASGKGIGSVRAPVPQDANSLSGTHMTGDNMPWLDHAVNGGVMWRGPAGIHAATTFTWQSGAWSGPIVTRIATGDPRFGPSALRLANGRMVSNPLATTIRFAYPTRGAGQLQAPALRLWNVRAGRTFGLGAGRTLDLSLDVFNVTNGAAEPAFAPTAHQQFSADFGATTGVQPPRSARFYARLAF